MIKSSKRFRITVDAPEVLDITRNVDDTVKGGDTGLELADRFGVKHTYDYPNDFINPRDVGIQVNSDQIPYSNEFPPSGYINNVPPNMRWVYTHATGGWWQGVYYPPNSTPPGYTAPTTPTPSPTTQFPDQAKGIITQVNVPTSTGKGLQFQIEILLRNIGGKDGKFSAKVDIPALGLSNQATASVYLPPFNTGRIRKTLLMPSNAAENQLYPASIVLNRHDLTTGDITEDDTEVSTIPGPNVTVPTTPPVDGTEYWSLVRKKCDPNTTLYSKAYLEGQGIQVLEYNTNPAELITCQACGCLHGWIVIKVNKSSFGSSLLASLGFVPGIVTSGTGSGTAAKIVLSSSTVKQGSSVAVACSNFAPGEKVIMVAKIGSTLVADDDHVMNSSGSGTEADLVFDKSTTLTGTAVVTATGETSGYVATANITVTTTTTPPTSTATIIPSASSVKQGASISILCSGFGASEYIDFTAKVGSTTVSTDNKQTIANGSIVLDTLTFSSTSPLGTAVITAKGRTSGRIATANVTVIAKTTTTTTPKITANKTTYNKGETISFTGSGFSGSEGVKIMTLNSAGVIINTKDVATSSGNFSGTITTGDFTGSGKLAARGRTSWLFAQYSITVNNPTTTTCPTGNITFSVSRVGTREYDIKFSNSMFKQGEVVECKYYNNATGSSFSSGHDSTEEIDGSTDTQTVKVPSGITCVKVYMRGRSSGVTRTGYFKPT